MSDLIDRQAAIDAIENEQKKIMRSDWAIDQAKFSAMSEIRALIADLPSVNTEKTGRWIRWYEVIESADGKSTDHIPHCKCSECNCEYDTYSAQFIKYCSNCGAKMEVEEDG